mgnify:CR=1 FL=1
MAQVPVQDMAHTARVVPAAGMASMAGRVSRGPRHTSLRPHGTRVTPPGWHAAPASTARLPLTFRQPACHVAARSAGMMAS